MVDLAEIQAAYYMVAATGVLVAAAYYVLNMKATLETRRIGLMQNILTKIANEEGQKRFFDLMNYTWTDYEDFDDKYGSEKNPEAAANRMEVWTNLNTVGLMVRKGLVSMDDIYSMGMVSIHFFWEKYKPIVEETRRRYNPDLCRELEYLAGEMLRYVQFKDPSFRVPEKLLNYDPNR
jgi:hypothetical protein